RAILEAAYDDAEGVSAAFALNCLARLNREAGANFDARQFRYAASYNAAEGHVEMFLVSLCDQTVRIGGYPITFSAGEKLQTELSYKYTLESFAALARMAGLSAQHVWSD